MRESAGSPGRASDAETVAFLDWSIPLLRLRRSGFRNFRGTLRKRLVRRMAELGIEGLAAYRARLEAVPEEWAVLDAICRIPISRFHRDRAVFELLAHEILPERAEAAARDARTSVRIWSAGCASGEEPYTVAILWHLVIAPNHPGVELDLLATDADETMLARAERRSYDEGSLRELPPGLSDVAFVRDGAFRVREELTRGVTFRREDMRVVMPDGPFDVILCRNAAFTYFDELTQQAVAAQLVARLRSGGAIVIGAHETLPGAFESLRRRAPCVYERIAEPPR